MIWPSRVFWILLLGFNLARIGAAELARPLAALNQETFETDLFAVTGTRPATVRGREVTILDRFTPKNLKLTRQYLNERLKGMGYARVQHDNFEISGLKEPYVKQNPASREHGKNYWVEIPGTERPEEIVTLGAHYDSTGKGMAGANDNGSGFAAVLNIAEALKASGIRPKRTIRIVFFDGEEMPPYFQGSKKFFENSRAKNEKNVLFLNLDQIGFNPINSNHVGYSAKFQPKITALLKAANVEAALNIKPVAYDPYLSDNLSASWQGIPAVAFFEEGKDSRGRTIQYEHYHQSTDVSSRVTPPYAMKVASWATASLLLAADSTDKYENTIAQKKKQFRNVADGFRDDGEPRIASRWDGLVVACAEKFSVLAE